MGLFTRAIRPPDDIVPNPNDPASVPPSTVGPDQLVRPGDPNGVEVTGPDNPGWWPPRIIPSAWSGYPAEWWPPLWGAYGHMQNLTDIAWACLDINSRVLGTMPPYLVNAAPSLSADWLRNPNPDVYFAWEEFARQLFWDFQGAGEAFVLSTARYATGWPARFHVVPPNLVEVEIVDGLREYRIGSERIDRMDILHLRYQGNVSDARGRGPLAAGSARIVASEALSRYATTVASAGGIPSSVLEYPLELSAEQAAVLQTQWVQARYSKIGEPAVLSGGATWKPIQMNPTDMALLDLLRFNEARIATLLGVPPEIVDLPGSGESNTYANVTNIQDQHFRQGLRPMAETVMSGLSEWLLPRGTRVELNADSYIRPAPLQRAQTAQILAGIVDPATGAQALTVQEIRAAERLDESTPADPTSGVLQ